MCCRPGYVSSLRNTTQHLTDPRRRPGGVVVPQVLGQHLSQVLLVEDQQPVPLEY